MLIQSDSPNQFSNYRFGGPTMYTNTQFSKTAMFLASLAVVALKDSTAAQYKALIEKGELQVTDHRFVIAKACGGQTLIRLVDAADVKTKSVTNLDRGKPAANQFMLLQGIKLVGINGASAPVLADIVGGNYTTIDNFTGLQNGWLTIKSDKKNILYQMPLSAFLNANRNDSELGIYLLDNPKPIYPERDLDIEIELGSASPANLVLKVELIGTCTTV